MYVNYDEFSQCVEKQVYVIAIIKLLINIHHHDYMNLCIVPGQLARLGGVFGKSKFG